MLDLAPLQVCHLEGITEQREERERPGQSGKELEVKEQILASVWATEMGKYHEIRKWLMDLTDAKGTREVCI